MRWVAIRPRAAQIRAAPLVPPFPVALGARDSARYAKQRRMVRVDRTDRRPIVRSEREKSPLRQARGPGPPALETGLVSLSGFAQPGG